MLKMLAKKAEIIKDKFWGNALARSGKTEALVIGGHGVGKTNPVYLKMPDTGSKNMLCIGAAASGKTRSCVKEILQMDKSYVVTDIDGHLYRELNEQLKENGYEVQYIDLLDFEGLAHFNFFEYIHSEIDIVNIANLLITEKKGADPYWRDISVEWLKAIIAHIWMDLPKELHNMETIMSYLQRSREEDESDLSPVDKEFAELEKIKGENHFPCEMYRAFNMYSSKTKKGMLISIGVEFSIYKVEVAKEFISSDTLHLETLGDKKRALFIGFSSKAPTFSILGTMIVAQALRESRYQAELRDSHKLAVPVRFLLDGFSSLLQIPGLDIELDEVHSHNISVALYIQSIVELKNLYPKNWTSVMDCCDTVLYMGGRDPENVDFLFNHFLQDIDDNTIDKSMISHMSCDKCLIIKREVKPAIPAIVPKQYFLPETGKREQKQRKIRRT